MLWLPRKPFFHFLKEKRNLKERKTKESNKEWKNRICVHSVPS
jgi:hypothetical protein